MADDDGDEQSENGGCGFHILGLICVWLAFRPDQGAKRCGSGSCDWAMPERCFTWSGLLLKHLGHLRGDSFVRILHLIDVLLIGIFHLVEQSTPASFVSLISAAQVKANAAGVLE